MDAGLALFVAGAFQRDHPPPESLTADLHPFPGVGAHDADDHNGDKQHADVVNPSDNRSDEWGKRDRTNAVGLLVLYPTQLLLIETNLG